MKLTKLLLYAIEKINYIYFVEIVHPVIGKSNKRLVVVQQQKT